MRTTRLYFPDLPADPGAALRIAGPEAHHALRVRRLGEGDTLWLLDGVGGSARAVIREVRKDRGEWSLLAQVEMFERQPPARPALDVLSAVPKGEHLEQMIDGLTQVGAASWSPLTAERCVVEPRAGKLERLLRVVQESSKQCGRARFMRLGEGRFFDDALAHGPVVVADASGDAWTPASDERLTLLVGPEGGWSPRELEHAARAGARISRFGVHTMRIETAAVVAAGIILAAGARP